VIRLGALSPTRDFNYVTDTVSAFLHAATLGPEHYGDVFNAGSGRKVSIGTIVDIVREITGTDREVVPDEQRLRPDASEVLTLIADSSKLNAASGWKSSVSIEEGLRRTVDWWRNRLATARHGAGYMV
jgi:UDP-glucose 4-epimerase